MRILLSAVTAKMGGAANYLHSIARELGNDRQHQFLFLLPATQARAIKYLAPNIRAIAHPIGDGSVARRLWFDQVELPRIIRRERIDALFSTANFASFFCPCRQVLLVRNSLYFSSLYRERILPQKSWVRRGAEALRRSLVCRSIKASDLVLIPSKAMADEMARALDIPSWRVSHYGVDRKRFCSARAARGEHDVVRLLFTSLYAEHKNLGTLFRALVRLKKIARQFKLTTTADPAWQGLTNSIRCQDHRLATELQQVGLLNLVGKLSGPSLDALYQNADIFVYPSVAESFGHPLVEAMASGLPIVAADVPVNRELCGRAALYFRPFDDGDCANQIQLLMDDAGLRRTLGESAERQVGNFSWSEHVRTLIEALTEQPRLPSENSGTGAPVQA
ncbi:MAG: glycosyltransferase family 4 protein [Acidobacteria bacterium]|nr:glycosyltransferase family 4 protein [Acidobacteriota bacterium]